MSTTLILSLEDGPMAAFPGELSVPLDTESLTMEDQRLLAVSRAGAEGDYDAFRRAVEEQREHAMPPPPRAVLTRIPEVTDDFIRNYLLRNRMSRTLDCFESEWYELFGAHAYRDAPVIPDNYLETATLQRRVEALETELKAHAETTARAVKLWQQTCKERDFHRFNHNRIVQEKHQMGRQLKLAHKHTEEVSPLISDLQRRCDALQKSKSLLTIERDKLQEQLRALERAVEEHAESGRNTRSPSKPVPEATTAMDASASRSAKTVSTKSPQRSTKQKSQSQKTAPGSGYAWPADVRSKTTATPVGVSEAATPVPKKIEGRNLGSTSQVAAPSLASTPATIRSKCSSASGLDSSLQSLPSLTDARDINPSRWKCRGSFAVHKVAATRLAIHPTRLAAATCSDDGTWSLFSLPRGEVILSGEGHKDYVASIAMHPGGMLAATGSGDKTIKLWNFSTSRCTQTLRVHTDAVWGLDFQETGQLLASASLDQTVRVHDVESGKCVQTLRGHVHAVNAVRWRPLTNLLYTASGDKTVSLWDARANCCVQTFYGHRSSVLSVSPHPRDADTLASSDADGLVIVWDARQLQQRMAVVCGPRAANEVTFDGVSGRYCAAASDDGTIKMIDTVTDSVTLLEGHASAVLGVAFDPTYGRYLVSSGSDGIVRYWK